MNISILVPFRTSSKRDPRIPAWDWIRRRWSVILPEAEIVMGEDDGGHPFSKTTAVNDAYKKSRGDMLVIADADSWVERNSIMQGLEFAERKERLVMPWTKSFRFTKPHSREIMEADPTGPLPVTTEHRMAGKDDAPSPATAAMVCIIQRRSFERVGGMDPRFRGWGSEDVSFGLACWTLLGRNAFTFGEAYALFHHRPLKEVASGYESPVIHVWPRDPGGLNYDLYVRYRNAQGRPKLMTPLCAEHSLGPPVGQHPEYNPEDVMFLDPRVGEDLGGPTPEMVRESQGGLGEGERITV